jgi:hypothetical protein
MTVSNHSFASRRSGRGLIWAIVITAAVTIAVAALLINIFERKQEGRDFFASSGRHDRGPGRLGQELPLNTTCTSAP